MSLDFKKFNTGTLFLVRTPEVFPVGYADESFADMKNNLHFDYAALLETWNCTDGIVWKSDKFPRSSFWKGEERDPIEECFIAADKYDMAFLPEAGMMHDAFMLANADAMTTDFNGKTKRYGRIGLVPSCPTTLEYLVEKYDTLLGKFGHHPSCKGVCLPCENAVDISYDKYTREAYRQEFGTKMPSPEELIANPVLDKQVMYFLEDCFLKMYRKLAQHIKQKYNLPLMHYPIDAISAASFCQPSSVLRSRNIKVMTQVKELDLLNMQLHPPLFPNPYFFKLETEYLMANSEEIPCVADTHFYHEGAAGRMPDMTPKRFVDSILSTVTPNGISFFCYGFMAEKLPLWKKELNPGAPVYRAYSNPQTLAARREMCVKSMDFVEKLRPMLEYTKQAADCAIYYPEEMNLDYMYSSYTTEHIFGLHELLNATTIPTKVIAMIPTTPQEQKALIMDSVRSISEEDAQKLEKYLQNGGKLILLGKCCERIEKIAGVNVVLTDSSMIQSPESVAYNHFLLRMPVDGKHYTETNGNPIIYYDNGKPAATKNGNVIYFGASDAVGRFSQYREFRLVEFWRKLLTEEKLDSGVSFHNIYVNRKDGHQFTSCDIFKNEEKALLFVRNFGIEHNHSTLEWELPENMKVVKALIDGEEFAFENGKELPIFEHFIAVYAEKE